MMIVKITPKNNGKPIKIPERRLITIGQEDVIPRMRDISKRHFAIMVKNGQVYLIDFSSKNGTFLIRGEKRTPISISIPATLQNGDIICIGESIAHFIVSITS
jgi:pSer/pThr/pTyr-binding forkhead associated (FHA) protein